MRRRKITIIIFAELISSDFFPLESPFPLKYCVKSTTHQSLFTMTRVLWEMHTFFFASWIILTDSRISQGIAAFPRSFARIMYKAANQFSEVAWYICEQCLSKLIGKKLELYTYARRRPETYSFVGLIMRWLYGVVRTRVRVTHLGTFVIRFIMQLSADTRRTHTGALMPPDPRIQQLEISL